MDEHDKRAREVVEKVRGMSPEAQALVLGNALRAASCRGYERGELAALATSNEEQAEAVAAERERKKSVAVERAAADLRSRGVEVSPAAVSAALASPAQAERVSEEHREKGLAAMSAILAMKE